MRTISHLKEMIMTHRQMIEMNEKDNINMKREIEWYKQEIEEVREFKKLKKQEKGDE